MASTPIGNEGAFTNTTPVTLLAAPASATQRVVPRGGLKVINRDTAARVITVRKVKGASTFNLFSQTVAAGARVAYDGVIVLDATNESIEGLTDAVAATTEPDFDVAAMETT